MAFETPSLIINDAVITASGTRPVFNAYDVKTLDLEVVASAVSGTSPSLTITAQWSLDGVNFGGNVAVGSAITTPITRVVGLTVEGPYFQLLYTVSGTTPSFTISAMVYEY